MIKAITEFNAFGECKIDIEKTKKLWTLLCRISRYGEEYWITEYTPKGKRKLKVRISSTDANRIIWDLALTEVKSDLFVYGATYLSV